MLGLVLFPFFLLFNYFLYRLIIKWLNILNKFFHYKFFRYLILTIQFILVMCPIIGFLLPSGYLRRIFQFLGNYYLGIMIYAGGILLCALVLKRIFKKFILRHNSNKVYAISGLVCILILSIISIYGVINARIIHSNHYEITINKKARKMNYLNIVMIADLHIGYNIGVDHLKRMVEKINKEKPEIVFIVGDIFDNEYDAIENPNQVIELFKSIKSKYGIYAVYGNHDINERVLMGFTFNDSKKKESDLKMDQLLDQAGIKLLRDEYVLIDDSFYVYGRPDYSKLGRDIDKRKKPNEVTEDLDSSKPIIVLDHQPRELEQLALAKVDLDLSGHTHDGQIFPLNLVMKLAYKNSYGIKKFGNMVSIVTSGVGLYGPNMRVMTSSEITSIKVNFKNY